MVQWGMKKTKQPRDINALAKSIVDLATGENPPADESSDGKDPHFVALGRLGGKKGGTSRAKSLTPEERTEHAKKMAQARWSPENTNK